MGGGGPEDGHDAVAGKVVDAAADLVDLVGEGGEDPIGHLPDAFRIAILRPGGEVGQITEQNGDDPALGSIYRGTLDRGELQAAVVAESSARNGRGAAPGAPQRARVRSCDHHGWGLPSGWPVGGGPDRSPGFRLVEIVILRTGGSLRARV